jgi:hypothetical protein
MKWGWSLEQNLDESWLDFHTVSSLAELKFELHIHSVSSLGIQIWAQYTHTHTHTNCWIQIWCPHCVTSQVVGWHRSEQCITTPVLHPNKDQGTNEQARCLSGVRGWNASKMKTATVDSSGGWWQPKKLSLQNPSGNWLSMSYVHIAIHQLCFGHVANCTLLHPIMTESKSPTTLKTNSPFGGAILLHCLLTS